MTLDKEFYTPTEVAKMIGSIPQHIYNLARQGYIKTTDVEVVKVQKMIAKDDVEAYLNKRAEREARQAEKVEKELSDK
jgi:hypothetical protein